MSDTGNQKKINKDAYVVGHAKGKGLKIARGDVRMPGTEVPECLHWKQQVLGSHLSLKWIVTKSEYDAQEKSEKYRLEQLKKRKDDERTRRKKAQTESLERPGIKEDKVPEGDGEIVESKEGDGTEDDSDVTPDPQNTDDNGTDDESKSDQTETQETVTTDEDPADPSEEDTPDGSDKPVLDLSKYDKNQLMELAQSLDLPIRGNKDDLKERILKHNAS